MTLPTLAPKQRQDALRKAAAARTARTQLLKAIACGEQTVSRSVGPGIRPTPSSQNQSRCPAQEPARLRPSQGHNAA